MRSISIKYSYNKRYTVQMNKRINAVIIPGLGGKYELYERAVKRWSRFGLKAHVFHINWEDNEVYSNKQKRLLKFIKDKAGDDPVAIVGVSAGASAALNAMIASTSVSRAITICGFVNYKQLNPVVMNQQQAFTQSLASLNKSIDQLDHSAILAYTSYLDAVVTPDASHIEGVTRRRIVAPGHLLGIATALLFYSHSFKKWLDVN